MIEKEFDVSEEFLEMTPSAAVEAIGRVICKQVLILVVTYKDTLAALSDPTRLTLLQELRRGPRTVAELASTVPVSRPAVSQHLRRLREARLVECRVDGPRRIYSLRSEAISELRAFVEELWDDVLAAYSRSPVDMSEEERK